MKYLVVLVVLAFAAVSGSMLRISMTDAAAEVAGAITVGRTEATRPAGADELPLMPGWPVKVPGNGNFGPARGVALADFDGDGKMEVIRPSAGAQLHVWKYDGTYYPGWPKTLSGMGQYAAAVADVDLDGDYEIATCTRGMTSGGKVYLFDENGNNEPGWPFSGLVGGNFSDAPTLVDINGDDTLEIIAGERDYPIGHLHVLNHHGQEFSRAWPCSLDHVPAMGAAVADLNRDGTVEIVYASYNTLYVFQPDGSQLAGWPQVNPTGRYFSYQSPALADVDGDDTLEIVVGMHRNGACFVWRYDGTILPGWPYAFSRWSYCPPAVADLYRNGDLKVLDGEAGVIGGAADVLYAFDDDGSVLSGFPVIQPSGDAAEGNIAVADIDGDADMEVIYSSNMMSSADTTGYLYAVHASGSPVSGWPLRPKGFTYMNGATIADVDGDDSLDIVAVSDDGTQTYVSIWEAGVPFGRLSWEWCTYQFDMARTGLYQEPVVGVEEPTARAAKGIASLSPSVLRSLEQLNLNIGAAGHAQVRLYDRLGCCVGMLLDGSVAAGTYALPLPAGVVQGVYFVRLSSDSGAAEFKLLVQK